MSDEEFNPDITKIYIRFNSLIDLVLGKEVAKNLAGKDCTNYSKLKESLNYIGFTDENKIEAAFFISQVQDYVLNPESQYFSEDGETVVSEEPDLTKLRNLNLDAAIIKIIANELKALINFAKNPEITSLGEAMRNSTERN